MKKPDIGKRKAFDRKYVLKGLVDKAGDSIDIYERVARATRGRVLLTPRNIFPTLVDLVKEGQVEVVGPSARDPRSRLYRKIDPDH